MSLRHAAIPPALVALALVAIVVATERPTSAQTEPSGTIVATVWNDRDEDGTIDPDEPVIRGFPVSVVGGAVDQQATTDTDGTVSFAGLPVGEYTVSATASDQSGWTTPQIVTVDVTDGASATVEFGRDEIAVVGRAWFDQDADATDDAGELPAAGVPIEASLFALGSLAPSDGTTATAADGSYRLGPIATFGTAVTATAPAGSIAVPPADPTAFIGQGTTTFVEEVANPCTSVSPDAESCLVDDVEIDWAIQPGGFDISVDATLSTPAATVGTAVSLDIAVERLTPYNPPIDVIVTNPAGLTYVGFDNPRSFWLETNPPSDTIAYSCILPPCGPSTIGPYDPLTVNFVAAAPGTYTIEVAGEVIGDEPFPNLDPTDDTDVVTLTVLDSLPATS